MSENRPIVLAIDDDPEWLEFIGLSIGDDYEFKSASCADDAVALAKDIEPSVIILDVMMQEHKDGFTAFSELQKDENCKGIPVIIFSEVNMVTSLGFGLEQIEQYLGARPMVFLEKPVTPERMRSEIDAAVRGS